MGAGVHFALGRKSEGSTMTSGALRMTQKAPPNTAPEERGDNILFLKAS